MMIMTTEHFTLQTARSSVNAEIGSRLSLYLGSLSSSIVALALAAQLSDAGDTFLYFAMVLLPVVYFLGLTTLGRLREASAEWRVYGQGMNRIRHYYLEVAPELEPYFVLPHTDDPWTSLEVVGISSKSWVKGMNTVDAVIGVINSVIAGVFLALLVDAFGLGRPWVTFAGVGGFLTSGIVLSVHGTRAFMSDMERTQVRFPAPPDQGDN
jgi:hypothetical protein